MSCLMREDTRPGTDPYIGVVDDDSDDYDDRDSNSSLPDQEFIPALEDLVTPLSMLWHPPSGYPPDPWRYDARVWLQHANGRPATQADGERYLAGCLRSSVVQQRRGCLLFVFDLPSQQRDENGGSDRILRGPWFTQQAVGHEMELAITITVVPPWGDVDNSVNVRTDWTWTCTVIARPWD